MGKLFKQMINSVLVKEKQLEEIIPDQKKSITKKSNYSLVLNLIFGITIVWLLYIFAFLEKSSERKTIAINEFKKAKKENKLALEEFKQTYKNTPEYLKYLSINKKYKESIKNHKQVIKDEKFLGFDDFRDFSYEFFPTLALLIYFLYNIFKSFLNSFKIVGPKIIHMIFINYAVFKMFWIFNLSDDLSKFEYFFSALVSTIAITIAVKFICKKEISRSERVKRKLVKVAYYANEYCEEDKKEKLNKILKQPI